MARRRYCDDVRPLLSLLLLISLLLRVENGGVFVDVVAIIPDGVRVCVWMGGCVRLMIQQVFKRKANAKEKD